MPAETWVNVGGTYRKVPSEMFVHVGGAFHNVNFAYLNVSGAWQTVFVRDVSAPPVPAPFAETGLGYNVLVTFGDHRDAITTTVESHIDASYGGGPWQTVYNIPGGSRVGGSFVDNILASGKRGQTCEYRLYAIDSLGNAAFSATSVAYQSRPYGGAIIRPYETITFDESIGWTTNPRLISGLYGNHQNHGFWFYGGQIQTLLRGWAPDRITFWMQKVSGSSLAGYVYICPHNTPSRTAGGPPFEYTDYTDGSNYLTTAVSNNELSPTWFPGMVNGTFAGIASIGYGQPFKMLYGWNERSDSGALTVYYDS